MTTPLIGKTRRVARGRLLAARKVIEDVFLFKETLRAAERKQDKQMLLALTMSSGIVMRQVPLALESLHDKKCPEAKQLRLWLDEEAAKVKDAVERDQVEFARVLKMKQPQLRQRIAGELKAESVL